MKVKIADAEEGVMHFIREMIATMPTTGHKFLGGIMAASNAKAIEDALQGFADEDGHIDTDEVRKAICAGFAASGDKVSFNVSDPRISWLVRPVNITISKADIEHVISEVEAKYR